MARLDPLPPEGWPPEMAEAVAALRPPQPRHPLPGRDPSRPKGLNALGVLARHPELTRAFHSFNGHVLFATTLSPRQRELLVLRVAAVRDCDYEWSQHVLMGLDAGLSVEEVRRVRQGSGADGWDVVEAALLAAAEELLVAARIGDATWSVLAEELDERQLMDVVFTVGAYDIVAMAFRSFEVVPDDDLRARLAETGFS
jgi:AhpD family alkylhydroperoxidase